MPTAAHKLGVHPSRRGTGPGRRTSRRGSEFEPSDRADVAMAQEEFIEEYPEMDLDESGSEEEGIPMWMMAAGGVAVAGGIWFLTRR